MPIGYTIRIPCSFRECNMKVRNCPRLFVRVGHLMAIRVVEFSSGGTKLEIFLPKNQHTQRKLLNFENWCNVKVSKSPLI